MNKQIWLAHYAEGVPSEADVRAYPSLRHLFESAVDRYRPLPAFTNLGMTLTYGDVERLSRDFAGYLQNDLEMRRGEHLALMLPNVLQYPIAMFGAFLAGLTVVNVNPQYTARELRQQLLDSGTRAIVVLENFAHTVQEVLAPCGIEIVITTRVGDLLAPPKSWITNFVVRHVKHMVPNCYIANAVRFTDILKHHRSRDLQAADLGPNDIAFLQYTSGTTGAPKGAALTHANVVANVRQNNLWCGQQVRDGEETVITPLPLYHVLALMVNLLSYFNFGGHNILITDPRDIRSLVKVLQRSRFSVITGVNTLYRALLDDPDFRSVDVSHLRSAVAGGAAVQREVAERWKAATGVAIVEGYGLTETGVLTCQPLNSTEWSPDVGLPYPSTEISIRDESSVELPLGEIGEVCARGPQVMTSYWNRPDETARAFTGDGWFRTGDLGCVDPAGRLKLVDRKKDMIIVSGFKVYPTEIEDLVKTLPSVDDAAVVGVPDQSSGEAVKLVVVRKDPNLQVESILAHCRANLTAYKCPKHIEFRTQLPKTPVGKVLRRSLREDDMGIKNKPMIT